MPHLHDIAIAQARRPIDALSVDANAIARAEIDRREVTALANEAGVTFGYAGIRNM
jgi:hypothetical protein